VRYAFEYVRAHGRRKVTCMTKDNIMKLTDGLFHRVFDEIAPQYPEIATSHMIIDIGTARMASRPTDFDVVVTPNLYGDILSDVAAQIAGSVGMAGSANIGEQCAMFEAIHGSAPDIAGRQLANPSGLLLAGVMMLAHIGRGKEAERIHNAFLRTLERGHHTADIHTAAHSVAKLGTAAFAQAVIANLGQDPTHFAPVRYADNQEPIQVELHYSRGDERPSLTENRELIGVDVFLYQEQADLDEWAAKLSAAAGDSFQLVMFTNRGTKVWPDGLPETFKTDHWRCRFKSKTGPVSVSAILALLVRLDDAGADLIKTEHLYDFGGKPAYSLGQGE
jgi:isocitrate dehydrogenase